MRLLLRKEGGDERVDHRFGDAVSDREEEHAPEEALEGQRLAARLVRGTGRERERRRHQMHDEGGEHQRSEPDAVGDEARQQDDDAEAGEATAGDGAQFRLREAVLLRPLAKDAGPDRESDARGEDRHEAGPEESLRIQPAGDRFNPIVVGGGRVLAGHAVPPFLMKAAPLGRP